jgi:hypothetical protein
MNHHQHVDEDDDDDDGVQPASNEEEQEGKDNRGSSSWHVTMATRSSWRAMMKGPPAPAATAGERRQR